MCTLRDSKYALYVHAKGEQILTLCVLDGQSLPRSWLPTSAPSQKYCSTTGRKGNGTEFSDGAVEHTSQKDSNFAPLKKPERRSAKWTWNTAMIQCDTLTVRANPWNTGANIKPDCSWWCMVILYLEVRVCLPVPLVILHNLCDILSDCCLPHLSGRWKTEQLDTQSGQNGFTVWMEFHD